ncbi:TVP38/TMEM64 family protein [Oscillatoria sp. CS-180]|uniref:TVP38/TMEM64 family protein n=1 Tax=Oscillatoria sp. CS-180 TaxID=3021720 RepID=UPI00232E9182|nr:TVP38/TMEM64 family protein [Oscillatoria sp. CS-180]MDB9529760.1 TVP38/TMEM64 family protein [Oscillatoria sp. CS-180]
MSRKRQRRLRSLWQRQNLIALGVLGLSLLVYIWVSRQADTNPLTPEGLRQLIDGTGIWGILAYIAIIALAVVISPIPGAPLTVAAGAVWGAIPAAIYSVAGGFLGGLIAYFVGRSLGRSAVKALTGKAVYFSKDRGEWLLGGIIFVTRLLPVLSFDLVSYGAGLTNLSLPIYASSTFFGMLPSTLLLTYVGQSFTVGLPLGIVLSVVFVILLILLPWGIRRYNWFGLQDIIHIVD